VAAGVDVPVREVGAGPEYDPRRLVALLIAGLRA